MAIPKYGGRDCELSTTGVDGVGEAIDSCRVTRDVLAQLSRAMKSMGIRVWSADSGHTGDAYLSPYAVDSLRHWTSGGQCYYADMGHVECCTASTLFPQQFAAQCISTLLACERARRLAEAEASTAVRYSLSATNSDLLDPAISFGTHISFSVSSALWEDLSIDHRRPATLGFVASAVAAAISFFGAGYLLPLKNGRTIYSLSARAHHISHMSTLSTTQAFHRGLLNSRREPHAQGCERLHLIGFDFCLLSSALLFSLLQCVLAVAEEGYCGLNLVDPVCAMRTWSWSLDHRTGQLPATAIMVTGAERTLPQYIRELATTLLEKCEDGLITEDVAPQAKEMLPRIIDLASYAEEGSLVACSRHLTWAAKRLWLERICGEDGVALGDPTTRLADHDFVNSDTNRGSLWRLWQEGLVDPLCKMEDAIACLSEGPVESRDWGRGRLIDRFADEIVDVDWNFVDFRDGNGYWSRRARVEMPQLNSLNKQFASLIESAANPAELCWLLKDNGRALTTRTNPIDNITSQLAHIRPSRD